MMKFFTRIVVLVCLGLSGCAVTNDVTMDASPTSTQPSLDDHPQGALPVQAEAPVNTLPSQNYFKTPKPAKLCAKAGYVYLLNEYLRPHCGATCHTIGGFAPPAFAAADDEIAYQAATPIGLDKMESFVKNNGFCLDCELDPSGDVFKGLDEWLRSPFGCN